MRTRARARTMFEQAAPSPFQRRPWVLATSVGVHCLVLFLALRPPNPTIIKVQQVRQGEGGKSLVRLYWSTDARDAAGGEASAREEHKQTAHSKQMPLPSKSLQLRFERKDRIIASNASNGTALSGSGKKVATAGVDYGSLSNYDVVNGPDVRPALWIAGPNPQLAASIFAEGLEGDVVVEITIDDQGNIIATHLLQSLSPAVDAAVLEALNQAHFVPAKRNGSPIPSKQDVHYHFPR